MSDLEGTYPLLSSYIQGIERNFGIKKEQFRGKKNRIEVDDEGSLKIVISSPIFIFMGKGCYLNRVPWKLFYQRVCGKL